MPRPPARDTAAASRPPAAPPIGAFTIGTAMPIASDHVVTNGTTRHVTSLLQLMTPVHGTGRGSTVPGQRQDGAPEVCHGLVDPCRLGCSRSDLGNGPFQIRRLHPSRAIGDVRRR